MNSINSENIFDKIYEETYHNILGYVLSKVNNLSHIEDIMQIIYFNYYKIISEKPDYVQNNNNFIFKLAKNEISNYYVKNQKVNVVSLNTDEQNSEEIPSIVNVEEEISNKYSVEEIWKEIDKLDLLTQKILMLYYSEDYKIKAIAKLLEMNESSVKTKLYRGIKIVKDNLREE